MRTLVMILCAVCVVGCTAVSEPEATPTDTPTLSGEGALVRVDTPTATSVSTETAVATVTETATATQTMIATTTFTPEPTHTATATSTAVALIPTETATSTMTATPMNCPVPTPEPLWVEPVISPTNLLTQTIVVRGGNSEWVEIDTGYDVFTQTGSFNARSNPAYVDITLQPSVTHQLLVSIRVREIQQGDCTFGGYTLRTRHDKLGDPLEIQQEDR